MFNKNKNLICVFFTVFLFSSIYADNNTWYYDAVASGANTEMEVLEKRLDNLEKSSLANSKKLDEINKTLIDLAKKLSNNAKPPPSNAVYNIPAGDSVVLGKPNAAITITEFTDFQ